MKSRNKRFALAAAACILVLSGCGNGSAAKGGAAPSVPTYDPKSGEKIELHFYSYNPYTQEEFDKHWGNLIREKFPNINPVYLNTGKKTMVKDLLAAGQDIDIAYDSIGFYNEEVVLTGLNMDMTDMIKASKIDLNRFEPTLIDAMKQLSGGKMYGLPVSNNTMVLFYNKDIFDKFGVAYPKDGMTWDEANAIGDKLTRKEGDVDYLGLAVSQSHALRMNQYSLPYVDPKTEKPTIQADPKWKTLLQTYLLDPTKNSVYKSYIEDNKNKVPFNNEFEKTKNLAMFGTVSNTMGDPALDALNWDVVSMPVLKDKPGVGMQAYPNYISVTGTSKHKEAAMAVIQYLLSDEVQAKMARTGDIPALKDPNIRKQYGQDLSFKNKNLMGALFTNGFAPISPKSIYDTDAEAAYRSHIVDVILNKMDLNTMLRQADDEAGKKIEQDKQK